MTKKQENRLSKELAREMLAEFDPTWKLAYITGEKNYQNFDKLETTGNLRGTVQDSSLIEVKK